MQVELLTPEKKVFSGDVYGVQLPGVNGSFEVLDKHAPMVSALAKGNVKIILDKTGKSNLFEISGGFIEVYENKVTVLLESAAAL